MMQNYGMIQSPLSITCQERDAWKTVERMSRTLKDRKVHAFAKHRITELSEQIMSIARDEMTSDDGGDGDVDENQADMVDFNE